MHLVPVVSSIGKPLMPCRQSRARELIRKGKAIKRFNRGIFYIQLTDREDGEIQEVVLGIDPGSKKEAFTIKSNKHTFFNLQADAVTWVKDRESLSTQLRRGRRYRKTPYRKNKLNRSRGGIPPSTLARWNLKLRILSWLKKMYPISIVVVENIKASTKKGAKKWNISFSPLEVGKEWFYNKIREKTELILVDGYQTYLMREFLGLTKSSNKMAESFDAHCVDSWVLANCYSGGHLEPDNTNILYLTPYQFHRRQLHVTNPVKGGTRKPYGGTMSLGRKRGSWVKHFKYGLCYIGGNSKGRLSLHSLDGKRLTQLGKTEDCQHITYSSWTLRKEKRHSAAS